MAARQLIYAAFSAGYKLTAPGYSDLAAFKGVLDKSLPVSPVRVDSPEGPTKGGE